MAKKVDGVSPKKRWRGFVDVKLPSEATWDAVAAECPAGGLREMIQDLVGQGYRVSLSYSKGNDGYCCALTGMAGTGDNQGLTMTTWGSLAERAICGAWYKHVVVRESGVWSPNGSQGMLEL